MGEVAPTKAAFLRSLVEDLGGAEAAFLASLLGAQPAPAPDQVALPPHRAQPTGGITCMDGSRAYDAGAFCADYLDSQNRPNDAR